MEKWSRSGLVIYNEIDDSVCCTNTVEEAEIIINAVNAKDCYKIKPIQWQIKKNGTKFCTTAVGHYEIGEDGFMYSPWICKYPSYEDALNACNDDYTKKVTSCLKEVCHRKA